jgi:phosphotransferase system enzyme I (PtsI)
MNAASAARAIADAGRAEPALTADGRRIAVLLNIAAPDDLAGLDPAICDGIGLVRTEFLFEASQGLPDEETQYAAYRRILDWAEGRPVTIRTLDAGGDKPIAGLTVRGESNPFLGLRGIRLSLSRPEVFRLQLRALARAAVHGALKVMLPMVTVPSELERARGLLDEEIAALEMKGILCACPPLGIMVEVPAAALRAEDFDAGFYSIGSNDLTQYTMAAARDIGAVADLNDTGNPAVLALIARTVEAGRARGVEVSLCGDAAADIRLTKALLTTGLTTLSVSPVAVARLKATIATVSP